MSTLKVDTVQHNTSGFNNVVTFADGAGTENGTLCRAWCHFTGTGTVSLDNDFNVTSITDNGTGNYTISYVNALPNANYAAVVNARNSLSLSTNANTVYNYSTTGCAVYVSTDGSSGSTYTAYDASECSFAAFA